MTDQHIDPERAQFDAFKALPRDRLIHMLNLVRFKATATYPAGHALADKGLSGADAYAHYGADSGPIFQRVGGRIVWRGTMQAMCSVPMPNIGMRCSSPNIRPAPPSWKWSPIRSIDRPSSTVRRPSQPRGSSAATRKRPCPRQFSANKALPVNAFSLRLFNQDRAIRVKD